MLVMLALGIDAVQHGFQQWIPSNLQKPGYNEVNASRILRDSALIGFPGHSDPVQQRVEIASALPPRNRVFLIDEPVPSVDPDAPSAVDSLLRSVATDNGTAMVCSPPQAGLVGTFADSVIGLRQSQNILAAPIARFDDRVQGLVHASPTEPTPPRQSSQR